MIHQGAPTSDFASYQITKHSVTDPSRGAAVVDSSLCEVVLFTTVWSDVALDVSIPEFVVAAAAETTGFAYSDK